MVLKNILHFNHLQSPQESYQQFYGLQFPLNLARNIARKSASSHWLFSIDIGFLPSPRLAPGFLTMIHSLDLLKEDPRVFVVPSFLIKDGYPLPKDKTAFLSLYNANIITPFEQRFDK